MDDNGNVDGQVGGDGRQWRWTAMDNDGDVW